jgi:hypothetical protein
MHLSPRSHSTSSAPLTLMRSVLNHRTPVAYKTSLVMFGHDHSCTPEAFADALERLAQVFPGQDADSSENRCAYSAAQ